MEQLYLPACGDMYFNYIMLSGNPEKYADTEKGSYYSKSTEAVMLNSGQLFPFQNHSRLRNNVLITKQSKQDRSPLMVHPLVSTNKSVFTSDSISWQFCFLCGQSRPGDINKEKFH
jgi:hypothetical protein